MKEYENRFEVTPAEHIRSIYAATRDGVVSIYHYPLNGEAPYSLPRHVDWSKDDCETLVARHTALTAALTRIGMLERESEGCLSDSEARLNLLTPEECEVWETYIRPFESFEAEDDVLFELFARIEAGDDLSEEEQDIIEQYDEWYTERCKERMPPVGDYSSVPVIQRARRFTKLVTLGAPAVVTGEESRLLAEDMVLYYYGK